MCSFPHFSPTCFDILSWNLAHDFLLMYYRSSSSVVNVCGSYAPFGTSNTENKHCDSFPHFSLTCFDMRGEILHMTFYHRTTDQVRVSSILVGIMPLLELRILEIHSFLHFFLTCFWHIELKLCIWLCFAVLQIKFKFRQFPLLFVGVVPLL